jgi:hypothetical protein
MGQCWACEEYYSGNIGSRLGFESARIACCNDWLEDVLELTGSIFLRSSNAFPIILILVPQLWVAGKSDDMFASATRTKSASMPGSEKYINMTATR